jgi:hypothetical protein
MDWISGGDGYAADGIGAYKRLLSWPAASQHHAGYDQDRDYKKQTVSHFSPPEKHGFGFMISIVIAGQEQILDTISLLSNVMYG